MNETVQILQDVVRNARTGVASTDALLKRAESPEMRRELDTERKQYGELMREGESALRAAGGTPEPVGMMTQTAMRLGLEVNTALDRSDDHIAEIAIQGATMGVIEMTKSMNTYPDAEGYARSLASKFVVSQNEIIERQKGFLVN